MDKSLFYFKDVNCLLYLLQVYLYIYLYAFNFFLFFFFGFMHISYVWGVLIPDCSMSA